MKAQELIRRLQRYAPDAEVYIETRQCSEGTKEEITRVRKLRDSESNDGMLELPGIVIE